MNGRVFVVIVRMLNAKPKISANEIAQELGISVRTVYRYLEELTMSGLPINAERGRYGGFSLDEDYRKDKHKITV